MIKNNDTSTHTKPLKEAAYKAKKKNLEKK